MTTQTRNEAAERLRQWLAVDGRYTDAHPMVDRLVDDALAAERSAGEREARRATVERLKPFMQHRAVPACAIYRNNYCDCGLDEEAAR